MTDPNRVFADIVLMGEVQWIRNALSCSYFTRIPTTAVIIPTVHLNTFIGDKERIQKAARVLAGKRYSLNDQFPQEIANFTQSSNRLGETTKKLS